MKDMLMKKLMSKKDKPKLSDVEKEAKLKVLGSLKSDMENMMGEGLKGLKKVTVASDSERGLKEGLEKAEEILEAKEESSDEEMSEDMESEDSEEMISEEEIDQKLKELMQLKEKMKLKA